MPLLSMQSVSVAFGGPPVLDGASLVLEPGERVALVGRNGAGKSTLMRLLEGVATPDAGEIVRQGGITVAYLPQDVPHGMQGTIYDVVAEGLGAAGQLLARYHDASMAVGAKPSDANLQALDRLHHALDAANAWRLHTRVETVVTSLALDPDLLFERASGGRQRQSLLARALVRQPDVLLLDEPTNHLDIDAIEWLERYLVDSGMALLFVTHDRAFLRRLATRILELDRGRLADWGNDYDTYLARKDDALRSEQQAWDEFDRKLAIEERWIRTGIQARRTRNEGRVRALEALRVERRDRRERLGTAAFSLQEGERSGRLVVDARDVTFARGERAIVRECSTTIMRGDRIGLIGANGSGKTTLLRLLLGDLVPAQGTVRHGTGLEIAYFDQLRAVLDPDTTVMQSVADGAEWVQLTEGRRHVLGYLQDFLFTPERARTPVRALSGGERNRLLLARLFTQRFNVLALDEPTNDLDIETLDLLEELLLDYRGTLLVVSHDREFLDHVVTSTLVMDGGGRVGEYAGGYSDWIRQRRPAAAAGSGNVAAARPATARPTSATRPGTAGGAAPPSAASRRKDKPRKLSFREQRELAELPDRIDALERERSALFARLADPAVLRDGAAVTVAMARVTAIDGEIADAMVRWEELESVATASD